LKKKGVFAEVYEASTRAGGRCLTIRDAFEGSQTAEAGGSAIEDHHTAIRHLCKELQLELLNLDDAEAPGTTSLYHFDGRTYAYADAVKDLKDLYPALHRDTVECQLPVTYDRHTRRARELDLLPMTSWIQQNVRGGIGSRLGRLITVAVGLEFGEDAPRLSALNLISLLGAASPGELWVGPSYWTRGGNDRISTTLADDLASVIRYGHELRGVEQSRNGTYELTFRTNTRTVKATADRLILALPFTVLRRIDYNRAGFRTMKVRAIRELGMGSNSKLHLQFTRRHWTAAGCNGLVYADPGYLALDVTAAQAGEQGILMHFTGGDQARSGATTPRRALSEIQHCLPGIAAQWNGRWHVKHWPSSPLTRGSYSMWKMGQHTSFAGIEGEVEGGCHFCGEHTSVESQGYLNGAVESGERAAQEVIAALS
jgi:monoamine oxidase